jgi:hypothetical protein
MLYKESFDEAILLISKFLASESNDCYCMIDRLFFIQILT